VLTEREVDTTVVLSVCVCLSVEVTPGAVLIDTVLSVTVFPEAVVVEAGRMLSVVLIETVVTVLTRVVVSDRVLAGWVNA
jgi:hypothetical protein